MSLGLNLGLTLGMRASGSSFVAPTAPIFYDFLTGEGWTAGTSNTINGLNGFTTLQDLSGAGSSAAVKTNTTAGYLFGTSANSAWHAAKSITTGSGWYRATVIGTCSLEMHRNMVGSSDTFIGLRLVTGVTGALSTSSLRVVNGSTTNIGLAASATVQAGDVYEFETDASGMRLLPFMNGRQLTLSTTVPVAGYDISALTITGKHGLIGNVSATGAVDDMEFGDASLHGRIRLYQPARVVQREANGDVILNVEGTYTASTPAALKYNITTSAGVAVQTAQPLLSPVIAAGSFSGKTSSFTPSASTKYVLTVYRDDATGANGGIIKAHGPYVLAGEVDASYGQSNMGNSFIGTTTATYTAPANSFTYQTSGISTPDGDAIIVAGVSNTPPAAALSTMGTDYSGVPVALVFGAQGSTTIEDRAPVGMTTYSGSAERAYYSLLNGIRMAGKGMRYCHWKDGESNANFTALSVGNTGNITSYPTTFVLLVNAMDTYNGRAMVYLMSPIGSYGTTNDTGNIANWEAMRRAQAKLAYDNPTRVKVSSYTYDLQHDTNQPGLHYSIDSYAIFWRRQMRYRDYLESKSAYHLLGPSIASVAKISGTQVDVTINLNTLDSLAIQNASGGSDCRGGLRFSTTSAGLAAGAGGDLSCTTVPTLQSSTATTETWRWTLTASTAGTIYVGGPAGENPFNPANTAATNTNFRTLACVMSGVKAAEDWVGLQPYWDFATGNDYLAAS